MTYDGPLSVLCDAQSIPILLFLGERGTCTKTDIYRGVSRTSNAPKRLEILAGSGLIQLDPSDDGRSTMVALTDRGERVVRSLHEIETALATQ